MGKPKIVVCIEATRVTGHWAPKVYVSGNDPREVAIAYIKVTGMADIRDAATADATRVAEELLK